MHYPTGVKVKKNNNINYANRGMTLESELNETNHFYLVNNIAVIYKKPTPITIHKVNYKSRNDAVIVDARFKIPSTTDYNGIYKGKYIDFEAKESHSKTSFPLKNIHPHQIEHLKMISKHGGIGFIIFYFSIYNEFYILKLDIILRYWNNQDERKSIPYSVFVNEGYKINEGYLPRLDYLKAIDYLEENN